MSVPRIITAEWLKKQKACSDQVKLFRKLYPKSKYPKGVRITERRLVAAVDAGFQVWWLVGYLTGAARDEYCRAVGQARDEYNRAIARAIWQALQIEWAKEGGMSLSEKVG